MLGKNEQIWRHLLVSAEAKPGLSWSMRTIANELAVSVSTVKRALEGPRRNGAVVVGEDGVVVAQADLLQNEWAKRRDANGDIAFVTCTGLSIPEIERRLPVGCVLSGYSALAQRTGRSAAAQTQVWCYGEAAKVERVFPQRAGATDLVVFSPDPLLREYAEGERPAVVPLCQLYADAFGLGGKEAEALRRSLNAVLAGAEAR